MEIEITILSDAVDKNATEINSLKKQIKKLVDAAWVNNQTICELEEENIDQQREIDLTASVLNNILTEIDLIKKTINKG